MFCVVLMSVSKARGGRGKGSKLILCINWLYFRCIYDWPLCVLVECVLGGSMLFVVEIEFVAADFI
jgi:hypothetical protein